MIQKTGRAVANVSAVFIASLATLIACSTSADVPAEQQAIVQRGNGGPEVMKLETVPVLEPAAGQVLIEVHAAAVNPIDWKMRVGYSGRGRPLGTPSPNEPAARIPGFDAAGVVVKLGPEVTEFAVGDEVFTMIGRISVDGLNGSYSQYVVAPVDNVVAKPKSFSFAEAAGLATVGMTAARTLDPADVEAGDRVFINGIAGGVGSSAAQIAKAAGATVIGTASSRHNDYLNSLGVDQIVDYTKVDFVDVVEPVDIYFETVNSELATHGLAIIKPGGQLVSAAGAPSQEACDAAEVKCPTMGPPPGPGASGGVSEGDYLRQVADLANQGKFKINVDKSYPLAEAGAAQEYNREGHTQGKVILIVVPN